MAINFNTGPYFDDFDPANNFYRVLFKPGFAVQARELNQMQSILQHQVSGVGNHLFKKNAMVIPGGITVNTTADIVSVSNINDPSVLVGKTITNAVSFDPTLDSTLDGYITAVVLSYRVATTTEPAALYVKYFKTQTDGRSTFNQSETISTVDPSGSLIAFSAHPTIGSTVGKVAILNPGTFYTKEIFVDTQQQFLIIETSNTTVTNCIIGLSITESVVTSDDDESLLDNANGYPNQYAPGADRYKIDLVLNRLDLTTTIDDDNFIRLMQIENDSTVYLNNKTEYAELMKTLARRTYDANGNFIVSGLDTSVVPATDDDYVTINVTRGKCYLGGYEYEQIVNTPISIEKPRGVEFQQTMPRTVTYNTGMAYFYVAGSSLLKEIPLPDSLVQFLDAAPGTSGVSVIGYGIFKDIQFAFGTPGTDDVYKVYFDYIAFEKGHSIESVGGIKSAVANEGAPVLHELRLSNIIGTFTPGNDIVPASGTGSTGLIYTYVNNSAYVIKDTLNPIPTTDTVKDSTTGATASRRLTFISNYTSDFVPLLEIDSSPIKTLYTTQNGTDVNTTSYSVIQRDVFSITTAGTYTLSTALTGGDLFEEFSTSDYFAFISSTGYEEFVDLTNLITLIDGGTRYQLSVPEASPMLSRTVVIYSTVNKNNVSEVSKTPVTVTAGLAIRTPSQSWMSLVHQDVIRVDKIVDGKTINITDATWATNVATVTATYTIEDGGDLYNHNTGDVVVIRNVKSANNTAGVYYSGFNGEYSISTVATATATVDSITTVTLTLTYSLTSNPGAYDTSSDSVICLAPDITNDLDVTSRYSWDSGNTAYLSGAGSIKLKKNATLAQGQLGVQYTYNTVSSGNYVSVDSYGLYTGDLSYIGQIADIKDAAGKLIESRRYIDFRTRPSNYFFKNIGTIQAGTNILKLRDLNLSSVQNTLSGKYVVGPSHLNGVTIASNGVKYNPLTGNTEITLSSNSSTTETGTFYIGLNGSGLSLIDTDAGAKSFKYPKDNTRLAYQHVKFLPRQVLVYVSRDQDKLSIKYDDIASLSEAAKLRRNETKLPLTYLYMDPYTVNISNVHPSKFENPVYQMLDIHNLKLRVDRNEYYTSLVLNTDIEQEIRIAGQENLTTSVFGFWNEDFMHPGAQDFNSSDFACTIYDKSYAAPGTVTRTINLQLDSTLNTTTWAQTGSAITLPYSETRAFGNNVASRSNNLNPYNMIQWNGKLKLNPSVDNWVDVSSSTSVTVNNTVNQTVVTPVTINPPVPQAPTIPPVIVPAPAVEEIITKIDVKKASWGPDRSGGKHAITFEWETNLGRRGRVNTDNHLSSVIRSLGKAGYDGSFANSLINKKYNEKGVKEYLNAGQHFDQKPPNQWK